MELAFAACWSLLVHLALARLLQMGRALGYDGLTKVVRGRELCERQNAKKEKERRGR